MSKDNGLRFLVMLVDKLPNRLMEVELGGKNFEVSARSDFLVVSLGENDGVATNSRRMLVDYLADSSLVLFGMIDEDIYDQFVQAVMKAVMEKGSTRADIGVLIGSMAESQPDETELLSYLFKGVR